MAVGTHVKKNGEKCWRVRRVINGIRVCEVFPFTDEGKTQAHLLDQLWLEEQTKARELADAIPKINEDGFLSNLYFHIRKNKIGPNNIYLRFRYDNKTHEIIVKETSEIFDFIADHLLRYKTAKNTISLDYYFLTPEKLFPTYKKEYLRLRKEVEKEFKAKTKKIQESLDKQKRLLEGK